MRLLADVDPQWNKLFLRDIIVIVHWKKWAGTILKSLKVDKKVSAIVASIWTFKELFHINIFLAIKYLSFFIGAIICPSVPPPVEVQVSPGRLAHFTNLMKTFARKAARGEPIVSVALTEEGHPRARLPRLMMRFGRVAFKLQVRLTILSVGRDGRVGLHQ